MLKVDVAEEVLECCLVDIFESDRVGFRLDTVKTESFRKVLEVMAKYPLDDVELCFLWYNLDGDVVRVFENFAVLLSATTT